ncbi:MAG TPA: ferritin-like domain-containing protein [Solirubrobacteraceae bacterium]|jgi:rubrerythrin|nr:ferritin-like domain-containing protein [Solirubrobacteraceae bacterium]
MSPQFNLEEIDVDGALRETAAEAHEALEGDTRLRFLTKAGALGGATLSGGALLSAFAPSAFAAGSRPPSATFGTGDVAILRYALTLEYLESAFYNEATASGAITDPQTKLFLTTTTRDENQHVKALKAALGSKAIKSPKFDFLGTTSSESLFQKTAYTLENTGVHAYLGQAPNIKSPKVLLTAASIVTVEARHAGSIGTILQSIIAPGPFDSGLPASAVLAAVKSTGFITG